MAGSNAQMAAFSAFNGYAPKEGPKCLTYPFDLTTGSGTIEDDLLLENTNGVIQFVQSVYVDNSTNINPLTIIFKITRQKLVIPAGAQGIWPVFSIDQTQFSISTVVDPSATGALIFLNVPMPLTQWGPTTVNANVTPIVKAGNLLDWSGAIVAGNTSQVAIPANINTNGWMIQNPPEEVEVLYLDFSVTATTTTSVQLAPGEKFEMFGGTVWVGLVNVMAATTGHLYIAKAIV